jgi:DNA-binding SARP family transcriptional activator
MLWPRAPGGEAKPWELLLFLACQPREGVAREDVIAAMWPEQETTTGAAHRFRQLRYKLRQSLADALGAPARDGICLERGGVLYLDASLVRSDAQHFQELVRLARVFPGDRAISRLEQARALYTADLFSAPGARQYAWMDERGPGGVTLREHFLRLYEQATLSLAELYVGCDQLEPAVELYRELTDLDPADERAWRALFRLHARRGDRGALLAEERRLRSLLRDLAADEDDAIDVDAVEPSPTLLEELNRVLDSLSVRERTPSAV